MTNSTEKTLLMVVVIGFVIIIFSGFGFAFLNHFNFMPGSGIPHLFPLGIIPLTLLVIWIFVIFWVYRDAESRGMSGLLWALLVFVGSIIGLLIYLIVRTNGFQPSITPDTSSPCKNCGKPVSHNFSYCPSCGTQIKDSCPDCGKTISKEWQICAYCGKKLNFE